MSTVANADIDVGGALPDGDGAAAGLALAGHEDTGGPP